MVEAEKIFRRPEGDQAACLEKCYALAEEKGFANVVRDEDDSLFETASQGAEFTLKLSSSDRIKRAEWLIHEQDGRIGGEGARDSHTLALAARKFAWMPSGKFSRIETN
jgi:hypothetical protein